MQVYIIGTVVATFFAMASQYFLNSNQIEKNNKTSIIKYRFSFGSIIGHILKYFSIAPLLLIAALREDIGTDYTHIYVQNFYKVLSGVREHMGFSYQMINVIVAKVSSDYHWVFLITAIIFLFFSYKSIYKVSPSYAISVLLLVITFNFLHFLNTERQFIAISITLYALTYLMKENKKLFILFTLIAASFHFSALVFLIVLIFDKFSFDGKKVIFLLIGLSVFRPVIGSIIGKIASYTPYVYYFTSKYNSAEWTKTQPMYILMNLLVLFTFIIANKDKCKDRNYSILIGVQLMATILSILMGEVPLLDRIMTYFSFVQIISIPYILLPKNKKIINIILISIVIFMYFGYFYFGLQFNWSGVNPYRTFININRIW